MRNALTSSKQKPAQLKHILLALVLGTLATFVTAWFSLTTGVVTAYNPGHPEKRSAQAIPQDSNGCPLSWNIVSSPNPGAFYNRIYGVAAISANDVWAVGSYGNNTDPMRHLILHWDGSVWTTVPSPNPGSSESVLNAVTALSSNDVWAVGKFFGGSRTQPLTMHWNGSGWSVVPSPSTTWQQNELKSVAAVSSNDVWAVGNTYDNSTGRSITLVEHWDGKAWTIVPSPNPGNSGNFLQGVTVVSTNDIWAVGSFYNSGGAGGMMIQHWDGASWSVILGPNPGTYSSLIAVHALSANDIWAIGSASDDPYNGNTLTIHWDGSSWSVVPSPNASSYSNYLTSIDAVSSDDIWAVGTYSLGKFGNSFRTFTMHWNGSTWNIVPSANRGTMHNYLYGVAAVSSTDVWAGGYTAGSPEGTLLERYSAPCVTPSPTVVPTNTPTATATPIIVLPTATASCIVGLNYVAVASTGATIVPANTYVPGSTCNACTVNVQLPFAYILYDTPYTSVNVSNRGNLQFSTNDPTGDNTCLPASSLGDAIIPYWDNLNTNVNDTMGIFTSVSGTAPNRVFTIEWRAGYVANDVRSRFQVKLYEVQPRFEFIYGATRQGFSATVGVQKGGDPTRFTQYSCNTQGTIPQGLRIVFDTRVCASQSPRK